MSRNFSSLPIKCRIYIIVIWVAAIAFLLFGFLKLEIPSHAIITSTELLFWASMVILSESLLIYLPLSGYLSIGTAIDLAVVLFFGPVLASLYGMLGAFSTLIVRRVHFYRIFFNAAQFILTMGVSSWVYQSLTSGVDLRANPQYIPAFILTVLVYFCLNSGLLSVVIGLSEGISPRIIWMQNHYWTIGYLWVLAAIGYLMVMVNLTLGKWAVVLLLLPVLLIRKAYSQYMNLKQMQDQLVQSERLAAVGQMAAGISHEIDNPIGIIMGNADYLLRKTPNDDSRIEELRIIRKETERCKAIVREFLDFARPKTKVENVDVNTAVRNAISLLRHEVATRSIDVVIQEDSSLPGTKGDMKKLEQVFINIVLNALQAMSKGGSLRITTRVVKQFQGEEVAKTRRIWKKKRAADAIEASFQDTGCGIAKENLKQVFMPFFTTKSRDGGRGLGLFVSYQIIQDHKGSFDIKSELGKGTTVIVSLPVIPNN